MESNQPFVAKPGHIYELVATHNLYSVFTVQSPTEPTLTVSYTTEKCREILDNLVGVIAELSLQEAVYIAEDALADVYDFVSPSTQAFPRVGYLIRNSNWPGRRVLFQSILNGGRYHAKLLKAVRIELPDLREAATASSPPNPKFISCLVDINTISNWRSCRQTRALWFDDLWELCGHNIPPKRGSYGRPGTPAPIDSNIQTQFYNSRDVTDSKVGIKISHKINLTIGHLLNYWENSVDKGATLETRADDLQRLGLVSKPNRGNILKNLRRAGFTTLSPQEAKKTFIALAQQALRAEPTETPVDINKAIAWSLLAVINPDSFDYIWMCPDSRFPLGGVANRRYRYLVRPKGPL